MVFLAHNAEVYRFLARVLARGFVFAVFLAWRGFAFVRAGLGGRGIGAAPPPS